MPLTSTAGAVGPRCVAVGLCSCRCITSCIQPSQYNARNKCCVKPRCSACRHSATELSKWGQFVVVYSMTREAKYRQTCGKYPRCGLCTFIHSTQFAIQPSSFIITRPATLCLQARHLFPARETILYSSSSNMREGDSYPHVTVQHSLRSGSRFSIAE